MANNESFLNKHGDKINAAGHAINTLQNAKIAERQQKIAQLQAATAALQHEENELKKKELKMLEKQQKALEEEQRRAREETIEKETLRAELLDLAPRLNRFLDSIMNKDYSDTSDRGKDIFEASSALAFINENKSVIEDINFHEYLYQLNEKLDNRLSRFSDDFNRFNKYLEEFYNFLEKNKQYFEIVQIIVGAETADITNRAKIKQYENNIAELIDQKKLTAYLIESLEEYEQEFLNKEFKFESRFATPPISKNIYKITIGFLRSLQTGQTDIKLIECKLDEIKAAYFAQDFINYLSKNKSYAGVKISELQDRLALIDLGLVDDEEVTRLKEAIAQYIKSVKNLIRRLSKSENNFYYEGIIQALESKTGVSPGNLLNELKDSKSKGLGILGCGISLLVFVSIITMLFIIIENQGIGFISSIFFTLIFLLFISRLLSKPTEKRVEISANYSSKVKQALKPLEIWGEK